nr:hypothetical protein [Kutzneria buriramensis]WKX06416.1 hypothetical protein Q4V64_02490 [Kutzneria buriramensis]
MSRELEYVMRPLQSHAPGLPADRPASPGAGWQRAALPGPRPH